ncbi:MAG TPA: helix-hairpin-helix domain-containing protein [Ktedonobacteraceae bacterium]|nr:helix-hairpin-helix domain-containing protein [Ktedonobacteraceae bacterium]
MNLIQLTQTVRIVPLAHLRRGKKALQPMLPGMEALDNSAPKVTNRQIAEVFASVADMIEAQNGNPYRIQAYRNAARGVLDLPEPAADILARGEALPVPGLGERLRTRIHELVESGSATINNGYYTQALPEGVRALMNLEHVGPYTAIRLYDELGIDSVEKLWRAAQQENIRHVAGFGIRSEARLKAVAEQAMKKNKQDHVTLGGAA